MRKPEGVKIDVPGKALVPNRRLSDPWPKTLAGPNTEFRNIHDYGGPQGWPTQAPTSATKTTSATSDPKAKDANELPHIITSVGRFS